MYVDCYTADKRSPEERDTEEYTGLQGASPKGSSDQRKELEAAANNRKEDFSKHFKPSIQGTTRSSFGKQLTSWLFGGSEKRNAGAPGSTYLKRKAGRTKKPDGRWILVFDISNNWL